LGDVVVGIDNRDGEGPRSRRAKRHPNRFPCFQRPNQSRLNWASARVARVGEEKLNLRRDGVPWSQVYHVKGAAGVTRGLHCVKASRRHGTNPGPAQVAAGDPPDIPDLEAQKIVALSERQLQFGYSQSRLRANRISRPDAEVAITVKGRENGSYAVVGNSKELLD